MFFNNVYMDLEHNEVKSKEELRFQYVYEQNLDKSCGLASLVTLLSKFYNLSVNEVEIVNKFLEEKYINENYSLMDLSRILDGYGFKNKSYKVDYFELKRISKLYSPMLVHYDKPTLHFVVLIGFIDNSVVIADSSQGLIFLSEEQFKMRWSGVVLLTASYEHKKNEVFQKELLTYTENKQKLIERKLRK